MITLLLSEEQRKFFIRTACEQVKQYQGEISVEDVDYICDMTNHQLFMFLRFMDNLLYG
jgi:hypothetical protein